MEILWTEDKALNLLKMSLNNQNARFRHGQWETINQLVNHSHKILLVQRTGWGKSVVYFISARILRDQKRGPTIIISPLLALMRNQIEAAERIGIRADHKYYSSNTVQYRCSWDDGNSKYERVVQDVCEQLGDIKTIRGQLARESLFLQNIRLQDKAARMAWIV